MAWLLLTELALLPALNFGCSQCTTVYCRCTACDTVLSICTAVAGVCVCAEPVAECSLVTVLVIRSPRGACINETTLHFLLRCTDTEDAYSRRGTCPGYPLHQWWQQQPCGGSSSRVMFFCQKVQFSWYITGQIVVGQVVGPAAFSDKAKAT